MLFSATSDAPDARQFINSLYIYIFDYFRVTYFYKIFLNLYIKSSYQLIFIKIYFFDIFIKTKNIIFLNYLPIYQLTFIKKKLIETQKASYLQKNLFKNLFRSVIYTFWIL